MRVLLFVLRVCRDRSRYPVTKLTGWLTGYLYAQVLEKEVFYSSSLTQTIKCCSFENVKKISLYHLSSSSFYSTICSQRCRWYFSRQLHESSSCPWALKLELPFTESQERKPDKRERERVGERARESVLFIVNDWEMKQAGWSWELILPLNCSVLVAGAPGRRRWIG